MGLYLVVEPEEGERARAGVRADDRAQRDDELELGLRPPPADERLELGRPLRRCGMRDAEPELRLVPGLRLERAASSANAFRSPRTA